MNTTIACRRRGSLVWTHFFRVPAWDWRSFRRHARLNRNKLEYARIVGDKYVSVL